MLIRHCLVPLVLVLPLLTVFLPQLTCAGDKKTRERTVRMRQLLKVEESLCKRTMISTKSLREKMEMGDFLAKLPELLPKDKKVTIEVDKKALGKEYAKFLKTPVEFPRFPDRMPFFTAFRFGLNQARKYDLDWKCSTGKITLTSPKNASFLVSYDLTTAMQLAPIWSADLRPPVYPKAGLYRLSANASKEERFALTAKILVQITRGKHWTRDNGVGVKNVKKPAGLFLAGQLFRSTPSASAELATGNRLIVRTNYETHMQIVDALVALKRLADLAVLMRTEVYEVDNLFYSRHVEPLLRKKGKKEVTFARPIDEPFIKKLRKHTRPIRDKEVKIWEGETAPFFTRQEVRTYTTDVVLDKRLGSLFLRNEYQTVLQGSTLKATVNVSDDRRSMRLNLTEITTQVLEVRKLKKAMPKLRKEFFVHLPIVKTTSRATSLQLFDVHPFLVVLDYRPENLRKRNRIRVLVTTPIIYIAEEQRQIRREMPRLKKKHNGKVMPLFKPQPQPKPKQLPKEPEIDDILRELVVDIVTGEAFARTRNFYGTPGEKRFALVDGKVAWPKWFQAGLVGYQQLRVVPERSTEKNRLYGITLHTLEIQRKNNKIVGVEISVSISNVGGHANGGVIGSCHVTWRGTKNGKKWTWSYGEIIDP